MHCTGFQGPRPFAATLSDGFAGDVKLVWIHHRQAVQRKLVSIDTLLVEEREARVSCGMKNVMSLPNATI